MENQGRLKATIGLPQAVALYIGAVLGSGVLLVPGLAAEIAGPASLLAWGLMTLLVLPMALTMGLLAAKFPNAGGVSHFVTKAFGTKAGTLVGWFFLMSVPIGAPVAAITGAGYLSAAMNWGEGTRILIALIMLVIGLATNLFGMKLAGQVQVAVVAAIISVLIMAIIGSMPNIESVHFTPFMPNGWISVGQAAAILFWCFIGWEAVSHLSEEFIDPQREAIKGVTIASIIVGVLYFLTAFATVGTHSYGAAGSDASLVFVIKGMLGPSGALIAGFTGVFICTATIIAYVGAASRLAYALASNGDAPKPFAALSKKYGTPLGGLGFLTLCFVIVLTLYGSGAVSLATLIQFPNATFILTYLGGCAAGIRLLKNNKWGVRISWLSFLLTAVIFPFVGWAVLYPLLIVGALWLNARMTKETFDTLVTRLEGEAERQPQAYKFRIFLLAVLGYGYIFLILALLLLLIALLVVLAAIDGLRMSTIQLGVILLALALVLVRALWVRFEPPEGIPLHPEQAKVLFQEVEDLRRDLKAPKVHQILLTDDYNAFMDQTPRLGIFGWQKNHLIVGLPLMSALTSDQFRSVLAHELGHLAGAHSRFGSWIYRVRKTWIQLMEILEREDHSGSFIFKRFFQWYVPVFDAYSFVLVRANEYEADRCSAKLAGEEQRAESLINASVKGAFLAKEFWPAVYQKADCQPEPPSTVYSNMQQALQTALDSEKAKKWLDLVLSQKTDSNDTHPSLSDRLSALGQGARIPARVNLTAAQYFFGDALEEFTDQLNRAWKESRLASWRERYEQVQEANNTCPLTDKK